MAKRNPDLILTQKGVRLPQGLVDQVEKLAYMEDSDFSKICRKALRAYLVAQGQLDNDLPF